MESSCSPQSLSSGERLSQIVFSDKVVSLSLAADATFEHRSDVG
jgi:hypothetical protein